MRPHLKRVIDALESSQWATSGAPDLRVGVQSGERFAQTVADDAAIHKARARAERRRPGNAVHVACREDDASEDWMRERTCAVI